MLLRVLSLTVAAGLIAAAPASAGQTVFKVVKASPRPRSRSRSRPVPRVLLGAVVARQPTKTAPNRVTVSKVGGRITGLAFGAVQASLGNAYLGTECSTELDGEPGGDEIAYAPVKPSAFKRKTVTLRWTGATNREGVAYAWSTRIVLERQRARS